MELWLMQCGIQGVLLADGPGDGFWRAWLGLWWWSSLLKDWAEVKVAQNVLGSSSAFRQGIFVCGLGLEFGLGLCSQGLGLRAARPTGVSGFWNGAEGGWEAGWRPHPWGRRCQGLRQTVHGGSPTATSCAMWEV